MSYLKKIDLEAANAAYADIVKQARELREKAAAARIIAKALDGKYITKAIEPKMKELFTDETWRVYYSNQNDWKYCAICRGHNYQNTWYIDLCPRNEKRVSAEYINKRADEDEAKAADLEAELPTFNETVATYNAIVTTYKAVREKLYSYGFHDLPYVW